MMLIGLKKRCEDISRPYTKHPTSRDQGWKVLNLIAYPSRMLQAWRLVLRWRKFVMLFGNSKEIKV